MDIILLQYLIYQPPNDRTLDVLRDLKFKKYFYLIKNEKKSIFKHYEYFKITWIGALPDAITIVKRKAQDLLDTGFPKVRIDFFRPFIPWYAEQMDQDVLQIIWDIPSLLSTGNKRCFKSRKQMESWEGMVQIISLLYF